MPVASSETQGRSVGPGEKAGRKFSSSGGKAPEYRLSPGHFQTVKRMLAPDWAQKMLCIIVSNRRTAPPEFFSWARTRRLLTRSRLVWLMHQRNARSQETPHFKILSTQKLKTLFQKYKLELTKGIHACFDHAFVNIREFKVPRLLKATKTSHKNKFTFFQSLSWLFQLAYFVKCKRTLLKLNFYQPYPSS